MECVICGEDGLTSMEEITEHHSLEHPRKVFDPVEYIVDCYECDKQILRGNAKPVMVKAGEDDEGRTLMGQAPHCPECFEEVTE